MAKTDYIVRLVMRVQANYAYEAPLEFVKYLNEGGLVTWIYRVEHPDTHEILGYFDGYGVPVDMDEVLAEDDADEEDENFGTVFPTPVETVPLPEPLVPLDITVTTSATPSPEPTTSATPSDAELLALAESLNEQEQL